MTTGRRIAALITEHRDNEMNAKSLHTPEASASMQTWLTGNIGLIKGNVTV